MHYDGALWHKLLYRPISPRPRPSFPLTLTTTISMRTALVHDDHAQLCNSIQIPVFIAPSPLFPIISPSPRFRGSWFLSSVTPRFNPGYLSSLWSKSQISLKICRLHPASVRVYRHYLQSAELPPSGPPCEPSYCENPLAVCVTLLLSTAFRCQHLHICFWRGERRLVDRKITSYSPV